MDLEATGLDADVALLTASGLMDVGGRFTFLAAESPREEKRVVRETIRFLGDYDILFTWRGRDFDYPFLLSRALRLRVDPTPLTEMTHIDLAEFVKHTLKLSRGDLYTASRFLGIRKDTSLSGADMPKVYIEALTERRGSWAKMRRHCRDDLQTLRSLFLRLRPVLRAAKPELAL